MEEGGIDGAIHRLAGSKLLLELQRLAPNGCQTGEVVVTSAEELPHKRIIYTPGPIWRGSEASEESLHAASYRNSLQAAHERSAQSIAFCVDLDGRLPLTSSPGCAHRS